MVEKPGANPEIPKKEDGAMSAIIFFIRRNA